VTNRRHFIAGMLATGLVPAPTWADAGGPAYLAAAGLSDGSFVLCGIDADLEVLFQLPLPGRGHAAAAHPSKPQAVAFARRPGNFALVIDCITGRVTATLHAPQGRHFYGHGVFSADGSLLYTTENDYANGIGRIGVWDAALDYVRVDEFASGGVGPHDIKRLPGGDTLVVANGGIDTHPDSGRAKLNIPTMRPNLTYINGRRISEQVELPPEMHRNSIRHLAVGSDGQVAFGMQWQGDGDAPALVALHRQGSAPLLLEAAEDMHGYIGSIVLSDDGAEIAVTSPRAGLVQMFDATRATYGRSIALTDVCGVAAASDDFIVTSGTGILQRLSGRRTPERPLMWDNHLVRL
jgi:uncharacterized protein